MILKKILKKIISKKLVKKLYKDAFDDKSAGCMYPNGHFYSPIVAFEDVKKREEAIWKNCDLNSILGIDLQANQQLELIQQFAKYYDEMPFKEKKQEGIRFQFDNIFYSYTDAIVLYSIIRQFKPSKIIEIGSGFSSAIMLDTNELFFQNQIDLTFIDPFADRLYTLMTEVDKQNSKVIETDVQLINLELFKQLNSGDILFVDSTHITKTGSDVNYILFEILPILNKGVLIHFHDIFYAFEYPKEWVYSGFNWNEAYILKAFLMNNDTYDIKIFSDYLHKHHANAFINLPLAYKNTGGNLWIEKK